MRWFEEQRQVWIAETLRVFGYINRCHIERKFSVSHQTAADDLRNFRIDNPDAMHYDTRAKRYVANVEPGT